MSAPPFPDAPLLVGQELAAEGVSWASERQVEVLEVYYFSVVNFYLGLPKGSLQGLIITRLMLHWEHQ